MGGGGTKLKILVVCQYYYPEQFQINEICEQLEKSGNSVTVLTGLPNYPSGIVPKEYRGHRKHIEIVNNVKVIRCFEIGRKKGLANLAINYFSYMVSASLKALFYKDDFDIIFVYQLSPITMALPGVVLKKKFKKPLYLYCCDIWPESLKSVIPDENHMLFKGIKKFSRYIYSHCDHISITAKSFTHYFITEHSIPFEKLSYIPQRAEDEYLQMDFTPDNDIVDFVFMGNIGISQDIDCIINAVDRIKIIPNFQVHFVGDGSYLQKSKELVKNKGLNNVIKFHGWYPLQQMPKFYKLADACLLTLKGDTKIGETIPLKLQGYMAAGKPVIAAINGSSREVINNALCGICVDASDDLALSEAMKDFILNREKFSESGERGREYFRENFTNIMFMSKLSEVMNKLTGG